MENIRVIKRRPKSMRLKGHDYADCGCYFVTVCTQNKQCIFGEIIEGYMRLNALGLFIDAYWKWLERLYPFVQLGPHVVMPNHMHGIVIYDDIPSHAIAASEKTKPLGQLIGAFKTVTTANINVMRDTPRLKVWQRNFHDHIIRNGKALERICEYIENNPMRWELDRLHPAFVDQW